MHGVGRYLLNVADFPELGIDRASGRRTNYCAKRVVSDDGVAHSDDFFFPDVTPVTGMRPAGWGGPPLSFRASKRNSLHQAGYALEARFRPHFDWMDPRRNPPWMAALAQPRMLSRRCPLGVEAISLYTMLSRQRHWVTRWMGRSASPRRLVVSFM